MRYMLSILLVIAGCVLIVLKHEQQPEYNFKGLTTKAQAFEAKAICDYARSVIDGESEQACGDAKEQ